MEKLNWINELKAMRAEVQAELTGLNPDNLIDLSKASKLMFTIGEINSSIIAQQEALINELTEQKAA